MKRQIASIDFIDKRPKYFESQHYINPETETLKQQLIEANMRNAILSNQIQNQLVRITYLENEVEKLRYQNDNSIIDTSHMADYIA